MTLALAGRVLVMFSFQGQMSTWKTPATLLAPGSADALTGATPLGALKNGILELSNQYADKLEFQERLRSIGGSLDFLAAKNYPVSGFDSQLTAWINNVFGTHLQKGYIDLFFGNVA